MPRARQKISAMRNLGPTMERALNAAGVYYAHEVRKLGARETFAKMIAGRAKLGRGAKCYNALYLYAIYGAIHDLDWRDIPARKKAEFKSYTNQLRQS